MFLFLAALMPCLIWDGDATQATRLGVERICSSSESNPKTVDKATPPNVDYRENEATASRSPWLDANGWRFVRTPKKPLYYDVQGDAAELAAIESFAYDGDAFIHTDAKGLAAFAKILAFLKTVQSVDLPAEANIGVVDDGSDDAGELMNLLSRHNLLYRVVAASDPNLDVNVKIGTKDYPQDQASDSAWMTHKVRSQLTDDKRLLRIYGSEVILARLLGNPDRARLHLINYSKNSVEGIRIRVKGSYARNELKMSGAPGAKLDEYSVEGGVTEFTIVTMNRYAVVDLFAN